MHKVISVVGLKGGSGKSTLASALAVQAARESKRVAMVDLDPQRSLVMWWERRGCSENPCIMSGVDTATEAVEAVGQTGWDWVFIDTPPAFIATIQDAIANADLALIPLRASAVDLLGSEDAVVMAREAGIPHLCVINDAEPRWKATKATRDYLLSEGVPVAETIISHRQAYVTAMTTGRSGPEVERPLKGQKAAQAEQEIASLWLEVKAAIRKAKKVRR